MTLVALLLSLSMGADWTSVVPLVNKAIARVEVMLGEETGTCSGVVVKSGEVGYLLTAGHCQAGEKPQATINHKHADLLRRNEILDLSLLRFIPKDETALVIAAAPAKQGEAVAFIGYPFGAHQLEIQTGVVALPVDEDGFMHVDANIIPGNSGGACVNEKGELVGITVAVKSYGPSHQALVVPLDTLKNFIAEYVETK